MTDDRSAWRTVERPIDVAKAFQDAVHSDTTQPVRIQKPKLESNSFREKCPAWAPLDSVPVRVFANEQIAWHELDDLSRDLLARVDGVTCTMGLVTNTNATPAESARALAALAVRGLVQLASASSAPA